MSGGEAAGRSAVGSAACAAASGRSGKEADADLRGVEALVLAAGHGTRIRSVAGSLPKPLLPVAGCAVLLRNLQWLAASGVDTVTINLHHGADAVRDAVERGAPASLKVHWMEEVDLLGTAGTTRHLLARPDHTLAAAAPAQHAGEDPQGTLAAATPPPLLVVYGDSLLRFDLAALCRSHHGHRPSVTLALFDPCSAPHTGIAGGKVRLDMRGRVIDLVEGAAVSAQAWAASTAWAAHSASTPLSPLDPRSWVNAGVYLVERDLFTRYPCSAEPLDFGRDVFPAILRQGGHLQGHDLAQHATRGHAYCLGLDTPQALEEAGRLLRAREVVLA